MVPEGWKQKKLGEIALFLDEQRKPVKESDRKQMAGPYPYYGASGIIDYVNAYIFDDDLILLGEDGGNILNRSTPLAFRVQGKIWVNNHAHVIKSGEEADTGFLCEYLESLRYDELNTSSAQPKLTRATCEAIQVLLPSLTEQRAIAAILATWDRAMAQLTRLIEEKRRLKQGLMQQLLDADSKHHHGNWSSVHLGDVFRERVETGRCDLPLLSITADRGVVPREDVEKRDTSSADKKMYKRIVAGDIGYNTMRMWQGVSALSTLEGIVSPAYTICIPKTGIIGAFAKHLFKYPPIVHQFWRHSQGLVDDTLNLKFPHFAEIKVTIPNEDDQRHIALILDTADREIDLLTSMLGIINKQKQALMQKLLTGEKRVSLPAEMRD